MSRRRVNGQVPLGTDQTITFGMRLLHHEHSCPGCKTPFRCHAPSCAGKTIFCAKCKLDQIEARLHAEWLRDNPRRASC